MGAKFPYCDYVFKVVMIGNKQVGKSCIARKFTYGTFTETNSSTVGAEFFTKIIELDGKVIKLHIWDTAGQEQFRTIVPLYYRLAHGIIVVYDCTNETSFSDVPYWLKSSKRHATDGVDRIIVGNKCDIKEEKVIDYNTVKVLANSVGVPFFETSAKYGTNLQDAFLTLITAVKKRTESALQMLDQADTAIELDKLAESVTSKCC